MFWEDEWYHVLKIPRIVFLHNSYFNLFCLENLHTRGFCLHLYLSISRISLKCKYEFSRILNFTFGGLHGARPPKAISIALPCYVICAAHLLTPLSSGQEGAFFPQLTIPNIF